MCQLPCNHRFLFPSIPLEMGRALEAASPVLGRERTLGCPGRSLRPHQGQRFRVHAFIQQTLNIHSEPGNVRDARISSKEQGRCSLLFPHRAQSVGRPGAGWRVGWGLSFHSLCLEHRGEVGRIVTPRWNWGWPCLVGEVRHEMPSWLGTHHSSIALYSPG